MLAIILKYSDLLLGLNCAFRKSAQKLHFINQLVYLRRQLSLDELSFILSRSRDERYSPILVAAFASFLKSIPELLRFLKASEAVFPERRVALAATPLNCLGSVGIVYDIIHNTYLNAGLK